MDIKTGDVVVLKSGSIPMTVARIEGEMAHCIWYNEMEGTFPSMDFIPETLDVLEDDEDILFEEEDEIDEEDMEHEPEEEEEEA